MITYSYGDILSENNQVITNPVNCVGVMGKGLALEFKKRFPEMYKDYVYRCRNGKVMLGEVYLWSGNNNEKILMFPTKYHWRDNSNLSHIDDGLKHLRENYKRLGITNIAMPAIGCGLGGLNWVDVSILINNNLKDIADLIVTVYLPKKEFENGKRAYNCKRN